MTNLSPEEIAAYDAAEGWEPPTRNYDPAHLAFARECYSAGYLAAMATYEANLRALHAEHRLRMLAEVERDAVIAWGRQHCPEFQGDGLRVAGTFVSDEGVCEGHEEPCDCVKAVREAAGLTPEEQDR